MIRVSLKRYQFICHFTGTFFVCFFLYGKAYQSHSSYKKKKSQKNYNRMGITIIVVPKSFNAQRTKKKFVTN
jgi:hypothetical protein